MLNNPLLVGLGDQAFSGGHKPGAHDHTFAAQSQRGQQPLPVGDASGRQHRDAELRRDPVGHDNGANPVHAGVTSHLISDDTNCVHALFLHPLGDLQAGGFVDDFAAGIVERLEIG